MSCPIEEYQKELTALCRDFRVRTLELFGSGTGDGFGEASDLDFLVQFQELSPSEHGRAYFGLWFALEDMFGRPVDLVETQAITNAYFLQAIRPQRRVVYAA